MSGTLTTTMGRPKKHHGGTESTRLPTWFMRRLRAILAGSDESIPDYIVRKLDGPSKADFDRAMIELPKKTQRPPEPKSDD